MEILESALSFLLPALPLSVTIILLMAAMFVVDKLFAKRYAGRSVQSLQRQATMLILSLIGLLIIIVVSPLSEAQKGQLLSLVGILLSATIALSATTFLGNAMAGIMLRAVRSFRTGDFVSVGDQFGRISERGLFHTEIQTESRDLTTVPNLYLVTNPVQVIRTSGTIVSAEVSLGYDVPRSQIKKLLLEAATAAELTDPYVLVTALGDFSVVYKVCGLLTDVSHLISARSRLREKMLDTLHDNGVEIVSPNFMNTRDVGVDQPFIPTPQMAEPPPAEEAAPEAVAFDKAEEAESVEALEARRTELEAKLKELTKQKKAADTDTERDRICARIEATTAAREQLAEIIRVRNEKLQD